jgi:hypothetical protein
MTTAFQLNVDQLELFFTICRELNLQTEEERTALLFAMAKLGKVERAWSTKRSKNKLVKDLAKHFNVTRITKTKEAQNVNDSRNH